MSRACRYMLDIPIPDGCAHACLHMFVCVSFPFIVTTLKDCLSSKPCFWHHYSVPIEPIITEKHLHVPLLCCDVKNLIVVMNISCFTRSNQYCLQFPINRANFTCLIVSDSNLRDFQDLITFGSSRNMKSLAWLLLLSVMVIFCVAEGMKLVRSSWQMM